MQIFELFMIAVGLSMDAFAVSVCKGLSLQRVTASVCTKVGVYFAVFQGGMPLIGYTIGTLFAKSIKEIDHWVVFVLLGIIGGSMVKESFAKQELDLNDSDGLGVWEMLLLAIATSIDALAVGVSFAFLSVNIVMAALFISIITFSLSFTGVRIGCVFGLKFKAKAEFAGGVILILMGVKILAEHLGLLPLL